jgi:hypothetical protein
MKNILMIPLFLFLHSLVIGQTSFEGKAAEIRRYIERNMNATDVKTAEVSIEFFVYDFLLDSTGNIISQKMLLLDSSTCIAQARNVAAAITSKYTFPKSKYRKVFLPVIIIHSGNENEQTNEDLAVLATAKVFELLSKKTLENIFITKHALIQQLE